jgi:hypothetical protein
MDDADLIALAGQRMVCRYRPGQPIHDRESGQDITDQVKRLLKEERLVEEPRTGEATFYIPKS